MVNIRGSASDRMRVPARPAQHVHVGVPDMRRRTRRSASTIGGGTPDMTIGPAAADQAGARPTCTVVREPFGGESLAAPWAFQATPLHISFVTFV